MWTTIYLAIGLEHAIKVKELLKKEGFLVKIRFLYKEGEDTVYEILAPDFEVDEVHMALFDLDII